MQTTCTETSTQFDFYTFWLNPINNYLKQHNYKNHIWHILLYDVFDIYDVFSLGYLGNQRQTEKNKLLFDYPVK